MKRVLKKSLIWFEVFVLVLFAELGTSEKVYGACFDVKEERFASSEFGGASNYR